MVTPENIIPREIPKRRGSRLPGIHSTPGNLFLDTKEIEALSNGVRPWSSEYEGELIDSVLDRIQWLAVSDPNRKFKNSPEGYASEGGIMYFTGYPVHKVLHDTDLGLQGLRMLVTGQVEEVVTPRIETDILKLSTAIIGGQLLTSEAIRDVVGHREYTPLHAMLAVPYLLLRRDHAIAVDQNSLILGRKQLENVSDCLEGSIRISPSIMSAYSRGDVQTILWPQDDPKLLIKSLFVASQMVRDEPGQLLTALDELNLPTQESLESRLLLAKEKALSLIELMNELGILYDPRFEPLAKGLVTLYSTDLSKTFDQLDGRTGRLSSMFIEDQAQNRHLPFHRDAQSIFDNFADQEVNEQIWKAKRRMHRKEVERREYKDYEFPRNLDTILQNIEDTATDLSRMSRARELERRRRDDRTSRLLYASRSPIPDRLQFEIEADKRIGKKARASEQSMADYASASVVLWTDLLRENFGDIKIESDADKQELLESMKQVFSIFRSDRSVPQTVKSLVEGLDEQSSHEEYSIHDIDRFLASLEDNSVILKWLFALKKQGEGHILNTINSGNNNIAFFHLARTMLYQLAITARGEGRRIPVKISEIISTPIGANNDAITTLQGIFKDIALKEGEIQPRDAEEPIRSIQEGAIDDLLDPSNVTRIKIEAARLKYANNSGIRLTCWEVERNRKKFNNWRWKGKNFFFPKKMSPYLTRVAMAATIAGGAYVVKNWEGKQSIRNILDHTADFMQNLGIFDDLDLGLDLGIGSRKYNTEEEFEKAYRIPGAISLEELSKTEPFVYGLNLGGFSSSFVPFHFQYDENFYIQRDVPDGFVETVGTIEELMSTEHSYIIREDMISNFINPPENSEIVGLRILGGNVNVRMQDNGAIILDGDLPQAIALITRPAELLDIGALRYGLEDISVGRILQKRPPGSVHVIARNFLEEDYLKALDYNSQLAGDPVLQQLHLQTVEALYALDWTLPENVEAGSEIVDNFVVDLTRHILTTRNYDLSPVIIDPIDNELPAPIWVANAKEEDNTPSGFYCQMGAQLIDQVLNTLNIQAAVETGFTLREQEGVIYATIGHQKASYTNFNGSHNLVDSTPIQMTNEEELQALVNADLPPSSDEIAQMRKDFFNDGEERGSGILGEIQESLNLRDASIALAISGLGLAAYSYKRRGRKKAEALKDRIRSYEVLEDLRPIVHPEGKRLSDVERLFTTSLYLQILSQTKRLDELESSIGVAVESFENVHGHYLGLIPVLFARLIEIPEACELFLPDIAEEDRREFVLNYIIDQIDNQEYELRNMLPDDAIDIQKEIDDIINILEVLFNGSYLRDTIMMMMTLGEEEELGLDSSRAELRLEKLDMLGRLMDKPRIGSVGKRIWGSLAEAVKVNKD